MQSNYLLVKIHNLYSLLRKNFQLIWNIFQGLIIAEAVSEAVKAAEKQAGDIKGFMDLSTEMAEDEGRIQGQKAGRAAGTLWTFNYFLNILLVKLLV